MATMTDIKAEKEKLRAESKAKLEALINDRENFYERQKELIEKIEPSNEFKKSKTILIYYPINYEFDISSLVISNPDKCWVLPRPIGDGRMLLFQINEMHELIDVKYGLKAPPSTNDLIDAKDLDLVIIPALAYDGDGYRLGRGAGYYDRLLKKIKRRTKTLGVIFYELILDKLPREKHDKKVSKLIVA